MEMYQLYRAVDSEEEKCVYCGAGQSRCLHGRYLLNFEDLQVGTCLKYVGQKENLLGQTGIVCDVEKGYFKIHWINQESKSGRGWHVTSTDGAGYHLLQFKFHCEAPADTNVGLVNEVPPDNVEPDHPQEQENTVNHCLTSWGGNVLFKFREWWGGKEGYWWEHAFTFL